MLRGVSKRRRRGELTSGGRSWGPPQRGSRVPVRGGKHKGSDYRKKKGETMDLGLRLGIFFGRTSVDWFRGARFLGGGSNPKEKI